MGVQWLLQKVDLMQKVAWRAAYWGISILFNLGQERAVEVSLHLLEEKQLSLAQVTQNNPVCSTLNMDITSH